MNEVWHTWPGCAAPWDPIAGRCRAPDEKTIRVVLDRLDPRALARALLRPGPRARRRSGGSSPASMRGYHAQRAAQQARTLARGRLRALALDGKTSRGARRADGARVHLLGVAEHGGHLLDHLEIGVKHNETSHFTQLLEPLDLDDAVVTFGALHTGRANLAWLVTDKKAHYIAIVKRNRPLLHAQIRPCPGGRYRPHLRPRDWARPRRDSGMEAMSISKFAAISLAGRPGFERDCGSLAFVGQPACAVHATDARGTRRRWRAVP